MGQLDKQPENFGAIEPQAAEALLRLMAQDIENLRQNLIGQLSQDVERLQREKNQLIEDIEKLQAQHQQQIVQQQQLVRQIGPTLVNQLQEILRQRLNEAVRSSQVSDRDATLPLSQQQGQNLARESSVDRLADSKRLSVPMANEYNADAYRLIASLDATLRTTFRTLQQDLNSYQSSLSQQLAQMYNLEQQGEAILAALVSRLREEIQSDASAIQNTSVPPPTAPPAPPLPEQAISRYSEVNRNGSIASYSSEHLVPAESLLPELPVASSQQPPQPQQASKFPMGLLLVMLSLLALSFEYVVVTLIFNQSLIFGQFELGGFVAPTVGNSLLILWLRMLLVVPSMAVLATRLYPPMWRDIQQFAQSKDRPLFFKILLSGLLLFLSQVLIFLALGLISPGVAITVFFIYPVVTTLLSWVLFSNRIFRPNLIRNLILLVVLIGFITITLGSSRVGELSRVGVSAATGSAIAYALYTMVIPTHEQKLHPVPFTWIYSVTLLIFSSLSLLVGLLLPQSWSFNIEPSIPWQSLIISSLVLAGTAVISYVSNNIGLSMISAARASILGATVPALTALLALLLIQKSMQGQQIFGMLLVIVGVAALSYERWRSQTKNI